MFWRNIPEKKNGSFEKTGNPLHHSRIQKTYQHTSRSGFTAAQRQPYVPQVKLEEYSFFFVVLVRVTDQMPSESTWQENLTFQRQRAGSRRSFPTFKNRRCIFKAVPIRKRAFWRLWQGKYTPDVAAPMSEWLWKSRDVPRTPAASRGTKRTRVFWLVQNCWKPWQNLHICIYIY